MALCVPIEGMDCSTKPYSDLSIQILRKQWVSQLRTVVVLGPLAQRPSLEALLGNESKAKHHGREPFGRPAGCELHFLEPTWFMLQLLGVIVRLGLWGFKCFVCGFDHQLRNEQDIFGS